MLKDGFRKCHRRQQHRLPLGCELRALPTHPHLPAFLIRVESMTPPAVQTQFTRGCVRELKNGHNSVTIQNRTHVYMNFFHHKGLGNHLLQLCPKVMKHPVFQFLETLSAISPLSSMLHSVCFTRYFLQLSPNLSLLILLGKLLLCNIL